MKDSTKPKKLSIALLAFKNKMKDRMSDAEDSDASEDKPDTDTSDSNPIFGAIAKELTGALLNNDASAVQASISRLIRVIKRSVEEE